MSEENKLVPRNPNEVVVPVGKANLVTTKEEIDGALEIAGRIFRKKENDAMENNFNEELEGSLNVETTTEPDATGTSDDVELVELTEDQVKALPNAKFGRNKYGQALNKDGTPRKARADKGTVRGKYGPRKPKTETEVSPTETTPEVVAEVVDNLI